MSKRGWLLVLASGVLGGVVLFVLARLNYITLPRGPNVSQLSADLSSAALAGALLAFLTGMIASDNEFRVKVRRLRGEITLRGTSFINDPADLTASKSNAGQQTPRERLISDLQRDSKVDDVKASWSLLALPPLVVGGFFLADFLDSTPVTSNFELAYAIAKRLGMMAVAFYLAHAAVSQYRYSTLRAAHYRACAQALSVCVDDRSLIQVYRMLAPGQAFGAVPTSPVDALVKIAAGKDDK